MWCVPELTKEFLERMEDLLRLYARELDPLEPVVCLDERPMVLREDARRGLPMKPGALKRRDYEHVRCGTANIFCIIEPLSGRRLTFASADRKHRDPPPRCKAVARNRLPPRDAHRTPLAERAFGDLLSLTMFDPDHSDEEDRFILMGSAGAGSWSWWPTSIALGPSVSSALDSRRSGSAGPMKAARRDRQEHNEMRGQYDFSAGVRGKYADFRLWTRIHAARHTYAPGRAIGPWFYAIAANLRREEWRRRYRRPEDPHPDPPVPGSASSPEDTALSSERDRAVRQALAALPDAQREVIELHRFEGLSFPEIAQVLGNGVEAVKSRAFRGYKALRVFLAEMKP